MEYRLIERDLFQNIKEGVIVFRGFDFTPRKKKSKEFVSIDRVTLVDSDLSTSIAVRQCRRRFERLLTLLSLLLETPDDSGTNLDEALDQLERFHRELLNKYRAYLSKKEWLLWEKKLALLEASIQEKQNWLYQHQKREEVAKGGKGR